MRRTLLTQRDVINRLKAEKLQAGLSTRSFARILKISAPYYQEILSGKYPPPKAVLNYLGLRKVIGYAPSGWKITRR